MAKFTFALYCVILSLLTVNADVITKKIKYGNLNIEIISNKVILNIRKDDGARLEASLYTVHPDVIKGEELIIEQDCEKLTTCIQTRNETSIKIKADPEREVIEVKRLVGNVNGELSDCFGLADDTEWFGGPQWRYQHWPIQHMYYEEEPYVTTHSQNMAIAERYWLSSKGIYVFADERDPLFLDQNNRMDKHLCLVAKNKQPYHQRSQVTLNYEIGVFDNPRDAHLNVVNTRFPKPTGHPNERMVTHPIWSTWARYKVDVNDSVVRQFADEIVSNGFKNSQIEIDDNWETCYGSATFDPNKFPDVPKLTADLKGKGFRVTLWIHPFINEKCNDGEAYDYALQNGYFVKNVEGQVHTSWWQGSDAAAIDFTNPKAVEWWIGRIRKLEALGIDSFKFDAGEESWLPQTPQLNSDLDLQPGVYTRDYTTVLASNFDDNIEVRSGWRSQNLPIFVRMIDKDTRWTWNNGLPTLITTLIQMNLNGYVFVLPDMIGGNGYNSELPSKELFIRWLQANVFMPSLQYSYVPWDYDTETIEISKVFTDLHAQYSPKIMEIMKKAVKTGEPINKPIWWADPKNTKAHMVNDEYLLGDEILVAPVIEEGARSRDIYLPEGWWKDAKTNVEYEGPKELINYPVPLDTLPYFIKVQKSNH